MKEDMRGVLFIVRGQYRRDYGEKFFNEVSESYHYIGGYDPSDSSNPEWYMLVENLTYHTLACGSDLEKVVRIARQYIQKYPTQERFRKMLNTLESKDSPVTKRIMEEVYKEFGHTYEDLIEGVVDTTYEEVQARIKGRLKKRADKVRKKNVLMNMASETPVLQEATAQTVVPHKRKKTRVRRLTL